MKEKNDNIKEKKNKNRDIGKIATRVIAAILALLMVLAMGATLIYYLIG